MWNMAAGPFVRGPSTLPSDYPPMKSSSPLRIVASLAAALAFASLAAAAAEPAGTNLPPVLNDHLIGRTVQAADGETIGTIDDLLLDEHGDLRAAIIRTGSLLGFGGRRIAVGRSALRVVPGSDRVIADLPPERLRDAPSYEPGRRPAIVTLDAAAHHR